MLRVSQLYIYPVKSLSGIAISCGRVTDRGLEHDRRWMLIDANRRFISQRELPQMALFKTMLHPEGIGITYTADRSSYLIPFQPETQEFDEVTIWDDTCTGQYVSPCADEWFSQKLGRACRLVFMPDEAHRVVDPNYAPAEKLTSFSDAYPFLLIGQESLNDLSSRIGQTIPMDRFRPNIVFSGGHPYLEDELAQFTINGITFQGVKLCARCPMPNIDQETAKMGKEPIKTLASYRRRMHKVYLGQNLIHQGQGLLSVGDELTVLTTKAPTVFE